MENFIKKVCNYLSEYKIRALAKTISGDIMDINCTDKQYAQYVNKKMPKSKLWRNMFHAFLVGGIICVIGQWLKEVFLAMGLTDTDSSTWTSAVLIFLGAFLTGLGVYDKIAVYAGGGTIVPITGFANSVVSPAMEFKSEGIVTGLCVKMFSVAGPVLVFGTLISVVIGIVYMIIG